MISEPATAVGKHSSQVWQEEPLTAAGNESQNTLAAGIDAMNWSSKRYRIRLENGDMESVTGIGNGLFGLSVDGVLTHLRTGYRVARFPDQAAGRAAGDYLAAAYAAEFAALHKVFRRSMTYDQYRALAETVDLNHKISGDRDFNRRLAEAGAELTSER